MDPDASSNLDQLLQRTASSALASLDAAVDVERCLLDLRTRADETVEDVPVKSVKPQ